MPKKGYKKKKEGKVQQKLNTKVKGNPGSTSAKKKRRDESPTAPTNQADKETVKASSKSYPKSKPSIYSGDQQSDKHKLPSIEEENKEENAIKALDNSSVDGSMHSAKTVKNTKDNHYNDSDGENSYANSIQSDDKSLNQDDENTVASDETSAIKKKDADKIILPKFTRYQMMILLDQTSNESPIEEEKQVEEKSPVERVKEFLNKFTTQVKKSDPEAKIISWKTNPNFTYMNMDDFPTELAESALYFQGYRANLKADKRIYMRVGIHTPNSQSKLYSLMDSWMRLHGYSFGKCILQSETSTNIGWLVYSTQYTDTEALRRRLTNISKFEWGFKLLAVTESDKEEKWLKRLRAVGVYVPTPCKDYALSIMGDQFEPELENINLTIPDLTDKFLFMEPERTYKGNDSRQKYYTQMLERHRLHCESYKVELSYGIKTDLDKVYQVNEYTSLSLRDIILDLQVETTHNLLHGTRLFHSVDYFEDSSNVWIDGQRCAGGACCIFTYYEEATTEAMTMIRGMGRMVAKEYDKDVAAKMFTLPHFRASNGYRWSSSQRRFSTPQVRQMVANKKYDRNLTSLRILEKLKFEKEIKQNEKDKLEEKKQRGKSKKEAVDSTMNQGILVEESSNIINSSPTSVLTESEEKSYSSEDSQANLTTEIRRKELAEMVKKTQDGDLDSLEDGSISKEKPGNINVQCSNSSIASSLTQDSINSAETESDFSIGTQGTSNSLISVGTETTPSTTARRAKYDMSASIVNKIGKAAIEEGLTPSELDARVNSYQDLKINQAKSNTKIQLEKFKKTHKFKTPIKNNNESKSTEQTDKSTPIKELPAPVNLFNNRSSKPPDLPVTQSKEITTPNIRNAGTSTPKSSYKDILKRSPPDKTIENNENNKSTRKSKRLENHQKHNTSTGNDNIGPKK